MIEAILPRPPRDADAGTLDDRFWDLVEARFRRLVTEHPETATFGGLHHADDRLADASRDAVLDDIAKDKAHLAAIRAIDPGQLSASVRFERDLEIHNLELSLFHEDVLRIWARRSTAVESIGDALFVLFARDFAPLADRLASMTGRLEAIPTALAQHRTRAAVPQVRLWQQLELETLHEMPSLFAELVAAGNGVLGEREQRRLESAAEKANVAIAEHGTWIEGSFDNAVDDWAIGPEKLDELVRLRGFDGLTTDQILGIGYEQLSLNHVGRHHAAYEIDPNGRELDVVERLKEAHPATFAEALAGYQTAMMRARDYIIEKDLVTVPAGEQIHVIETPEYARNLIPFAAYFEPARFDAVPLGIYIVTPSVGHDPSAMREHNYSSISNTSIHEAYPGHHLQLAAALANPSLTRFQADAPEFVEGWAMYCEQMMREEGFDAGPEFRLAMHTDAIWRASRIILDIRMHRGDLSIEGATDFLVRETRFERANAQAEVHRYSYTPTYQLSYLLGKTLILGLREDERKRLGSSFSLRDFHDTLMRNGSLPISFHRRLLRGEG